jgi:hypothetical protein
MQASRKDMQYILHKQFARPEKIGRGVFCFDRNGDAQFFSGIAERDS